jgi:CBS domain containing-hemolysin-like protein
MQKMRATFDAASLARNGSEAPQPSRHLLLVLLNAVFFAAGISIVKVRTGQHCPLLGEGRKTAVTVKHILGNMGAYLIAHLPGAASGSIHVRKASLTLIEVLLPRRGGGRLEFSMPVRLME